MNADDLIERLFNLSSRLTIHNDSVETWKEMTKDFYDFIKHEEKILDVPSSKKAPSYLCIKNMNAEQVWQQMEMNNASLIARSAIRLDKSNLCVKIAELSSKIDEEYDQQDKEAVITDDEGVETGEDTDDENGLMDRTSDLDREFTDDELSPAEDEADIDDEADENEVDFSDLDADTFGDIAVEGSDDDDDDDEEEDKLVKENSDTDIHENQDTNDAKISRSKAIKKSFGSSNVDSKFFNLRESEWVADNDLIGEGFDDVDFMEENDDDGQSDDGVGTMYNSFFDPPSEILKIDEEETTVESATQEQEQPKSKFDEIIDEENAVKEELENEFYLSEKPWVLKGEVQKQMRPENSTLEEHLEYVVSIRQKPIITEETTQQIEKLILSRVRNQTWDDVERKIKPQADPFQYKKDLVLDHEKSKKSLATIYEEEFLKKQQEEKGTSVNQSSVLLEPDEKWEELPIHKQIREEMEDLFMKLDALSNYHYTPKYKRPDIKVVSNLPAVTVEESTPTTASDATLLAPQEVVAPLRGELKGETEKEKTDKKRERRAKKKHQKLRAKKEEAKLNAQMKKRGKDGLLKTDASVKFVQKAVSKGQIKVLDNEQKSVKSASSFFKQLQDNVENRTQKRKYEGKDMKGKKKKKTEMTMAKLLL